MLDTRHAHFTNFCFQALCLVTLASAFCSSHKLQALCITNKYLDVVSVAGCHSLMRELYLWQWIYRKCAAIWSPFWFRGIQGSCLSSRLFKVLFSSLFSPLWRWLGSHALRVNSFQRNWQHNKYFYEVCLAAYVTQVFVFFICLFVMLFVGFFCGGGKTDEGYRHAICIVLEILPTL